MKSDSQNTVSNSDKTPDDVIRRSLPIQTWALGVVGSIYRTTERFVRNIPSRIRNKYRRYLNEKKRMPRRKTKSKVYVLVGYTTRQHVDRHFAALKVQHLIRTILLLSILLVFIVIMYKWLDPLGKTNELKQIVGIDRITDLAEDDPFVPAESSNDFIVSVTITPTPAP